MKALLELSKAAATSLCILDTLLWADETHNPSIDWEPLNLFHESECAFSRPTSPCDKEFYSKFPLPLGGITLSSE